jgi:hypothetical protein
MAPTGPKAAPSSKPKQTPIALATKRVNRALRAIRLIGATPASPEQAKKIMDALSNQLAVLEVDLAKRGVQSSGSFSFEE